MNAATKIKNLLLVAFTIGFAVWAIAGAYSTAEDGNVVLESKIAEGANPDDLVGSETSKACQEDQFKKFSGTKHAKLTEVASWRDKAKGCESCHGPGKEHVENGGDKTKIISFVGKNSKEISETCLSCHAGKENHNNFHRGEHFRNDVGCTDCHTSHGSPFTNAKPDSASFPA